MPRSPQHAEQQQTPLDLGLRRSPIINDLLASAACMQQQHGSREWSISLPGSPLEPRPSLRMWVQQAAPLQRTEQPDRTLDLVSPIPDVVQLEQHLPPAPESEITPGEVLHRAFWPPPTSHVWRHPCQACHTATGFYAGGGSEGGSGPRQLSGLPCKLSAITSPPVLVPAQAQPPLDADVSTGGAPPPGPLWSALTSTAGMDPIADLSHVAAFQPTAAAAVERVAADALAAAGQRPLNSLLPPALLPRSSCTPLPAKALGTQKENLPLGSTGSRPQRSGKFVAANPFASFACSGGN